MKAIVYQKYGNPDVLKLKEVNKPIPKDNEVLIKVHATEASAGDCEIRRFNIGVWPIIFWLPLRIYFGIRKPRKPTILGAYLAGEIEAVGKDVKQFKKGDQIFAGSGLGFGGYGEYVCRPSTSPMAIKPSNMTYDEASCVPLGGLNALHFLRKANIKKGQKVLINGAGGSMGTFAVQLAKYFGAHVTAVDSTGKLKMLRKIGADEVIDYTKENYTKNGEKYDVIFSVVKGSYSRVVRSLKKNGVYLLANPTMLDMFRSFLTPIISSKNVIFEFANEKTEDLIYLRKLIESGKIKSVIDKRYPLEQTAEAHRYVETGQKKGNVVITLEHNNKI